MMILIEGGEVYTPQPIGKASVLLGGGKLLKVGPVDRRGLDLLGVEYEVIDAAGCAVAPGLIDPHEHLLGGSGEKGFSTQTPEVTLGEIVGAGITTVVGCLGVDTTMKTMAGLLARAKGLTEEGLSAFVWTGGYSVPPTTVLNSARDDVLFIAEVIGSGEIAISDGRSLDPSAFELARLVSDTHVGGMLSGKAGVTHFHVGEGRKRLSLLRALIDDYDVEAGWLYPTHVERSEALMKEAVALTRRGATVDIDTVENDLAKWLKFYLEAGGDPERLTVSSDASLTAPHHVYGQLRSCVVENGFTLERALPLATSNTARVLKLPDKGRLQEGRDADVLVLRGRSLEIVELMARGKRMVRGGRLAVRERFLEGCDRDIHLTGTKAG